MAPLIVNHVVGDHGTFAEVFPDDQERRRLPGSRGARVHRVVGDPDNVRVVLEFDTVEEAKRHADDLELHEAIAWTSGNVSMPSLEVPGSARTRAPRSFRGPVDSPPRPGRIPVVRTASSA